MSDWKTVALGSLVQNLDWKRVPVKQSERRAGPYPYYGASGIVDWITDYLFEGEHLLVAEDGENLNSRSLPIAFRATGKFWVNNHAHILKAPSHLLRFLEHYLNSMDISGWVTGSAQPKLTQANLNSIPISLPADDGELKAIARVLGALDDKIELNRRINRTLEELATTLFRSWFVDFDPVVAKAAGRKPAHLRPELASLFPAHFQDSALGPIPQGWRIGTVGEIMEVTMGQSPPGETYNEKGEGVPFFQGRTDFGFRFPTKRVFCTAPTRHAKKGDILLSVRAPVGDANIAFEDCSIGRGLAALRARNGEHSFSFYALRSQTDEFASFEGEGTLFGAINGPALRGLRLIIPPPALMKAFEKCAMPWDSMIENNERESLTLAALRDTLLPKLLSGELRVKQAEKRVADAI